MPGDHLVSCLMVTKPSPERLSFVRRSIAAYLAQSYPSRELVIVGQGSGDTAGAIARHVAALHRHDIRLLAAAEDLPLGALRNRSMEAARGSILCQWDDDDHHHPERIARQVGAMTAAGRRACYLQDVLHYLVRPRELYWTTWTRTPGQAFPGAALFERSLAVRYPETGAEARLGEDLVVLETLRGAGEVAMLGGEPHLYVYVTHETNSWPLAHHRMLVDRLALSQALLVRREPQIRAGLGACDFGPGTVTVMGSNGPAFTLSEAMPRPTGA